jgi:hypothetical protein
MLDVTAIIPAGATAEIAGMIAGTLTVEPGASLSAAWLTGISSIAAATSP